MNIGKIVALAALCGGMLTMTATTASAAVVCNGEGECWHVRHHYRYRPEWGVVVRPNNWRWGPNEHYVWREHRGRGYWRGGVWIGY
jgi:hypothetical protein